MSSSIPNPVGAMPVNTFGDRHVRSRSASAKSSFVELDLEFVNDREARVVLAQLGLMMGRGNRGTREVAVKIDVPQVDKLILAPHTPMFSQCVLQTSADHPAGVSFGGMSPFTVGRADRENDFLS